MTITLPGKGTVPAWLRFIFLDGPRAFGRGVWRHPKLWMLLLLTAALSVMLGRNAGYTVYALVLLPVWRLAKPVSFKRWVWVPLRQDWRRCWRYDRHWPDVMKENGLSIVRRNALDVHPQIVRVRCDGHGDTLWIRSLIGKGIDDWQERAAGIADDFGARAGRVYAGPLGQRRWRFWELRFDVRLELAYGPDPLAETIPALPIPQESTDVDFSAVPVGLTERGDPWTLNIGLHVLLAGKIGSGKSSALWSLLRGLAPAIRDGLAEVYAIDPKGGIELGFGKELFTGYEDRDMQAMGAMLGDLVTLMDKALRRIAKDGQVRKHTPSVDSPLRLIVIDEFASITDYLGSDKASRDLSNQIKASLRTILNQGRAPGFIIVGALQDPRIEVLPMRNSFPQRVGFRLETDDEVEMALAPKAYRRGAECTRIPISMQGTAYVLRDGEAEFTRVRAAYVDDEQILKMAAEYAPADDEARPLAGQVVR